MGINIIFLIVRQLHAHAWVEVFIDDRGWIRVDPTAAISAQWTERSLQTDSSRRSMTKFELSGEVYETPSELSYWDHIRYHIDGIGLRWNDWVLNYDTNKHKALFKALGNENLRYCPPGDSTRAEKEQELMQLVKVL